MRRLLPIYLAAGASIGVILAYLLAGGASYKPLDAADPCEPRPLSVLTERGIFEGIALSALDGAACELQVTREELTAALTSDELLEEFSAEHDVSEEDVEAAIRAGLLRAIDDAELEGLVPGPLAGVAEGLVENAPIPAVIELFRSLPGDPTIPELLRAIQGLDLAPSQLGDTLEGLIPDDLKDLEGLLPEDLDGLIPDDLQGLGLEGLRGLPDDLQGELERFQGDLERLFPDLDREDLPLELQELLRRQSGDG
jgi:hypothetical protein